MPQKRGVGRWFGNQTSRVLPSQLLEAAGLCVVYGVLCSLPQTELLTSAVAHFGVVKWQT